VSCPPSHCYRHDGEPYCFCSGCHATFRAVRSYGRLLFYYRATPFCFNDALEASGQRDACLFFGFLWISGYSVYLRRLLPDQQISLTDPDSRSMATSGRGSGVVGYNVQVAVDTEHHLIVAHEVTNSFARGSAFRIWESDAGRGPGASIR
jgi:hypothetical protein